MTLLEEITLEERNVIEELKERTLKDITPKLLDDPTLFYRFAKARNFDLKQAEAMLRKHIQFRKEYKVDTILTHYNGPEVLKLYMPSSFIGYDKDGCPIHYVSVSNGDPKGLINSAKKYDLIKYNIQLIEQDVKKLEEQSEKLGKPLSRIVYIYDFNKLSFAKATNKESIELMMMGVTIYQDNYPERIKSIYCINCSIYFTMLYSIVKMVVASAVIEKTKMFGLDGWKEAFLQIMEPEDFPAFLGGKRTDPDGNPLCKTFINHGGQVPEHFYLQKSKKILHQEPGVKKLNVTRFSSTNLTFDVDEPGSFLEWEFETKSRDIGFGVYFKDKSLNDSNLVELVPKQRFDTCIEPETGMYRCDKAGLYVIVFDNSYSWIYPKEIYYRTSILPPSEYKNE